MDYIKIPTSDSHRIYVPKLAAGRDFLAEATAWQDYSLEYQGRVWLGYELLPGTEAPIVELLEKLFNAEDVTEDYLNQLKFSK